MKQTTIIIIAVVASVVVTLGIIEGIAYYNQYAYEQAFLAPARQQMQIEKQFEVIIARVDSCGSITNTTTPEQESKIVECKKNAREDARNLLERYGIEDQRVIQVILNSYPAFFPQFYAENSQFVKQFEVILARVNSCGSITNTITTEQESKIVECKKNAREDVRNLLERYGIEDQRVRQEILNSYPAFFPQFYAENSQFDVFAFNEWKKKYDDLLLECEKIKKWEDDPVYQICLDLVDEKTDSAQKFLDEYVAKQKFIDEYVAKQNP